MINTIKKFIGRLTNCFSASSESEKKRGKEAKKPAEKKTNG